MTASASRKLSLGLSDTDEDEAAESAVESCEYTPGKYYSYCEIHAGSAVTLSAAPLSSPQGFEEEEDTSCIYDRLAKVFAKDVERLVELVINYEGGEEAGGKKAVLQSTLNQLQALRTSVSINMHFMILASLWPTKDEDQ